MVMLYVSLVVFGCARHNFAQHWTCWVGVFVCVCACVYVRTTDEIFSVHKHTSFYRPNQEECVYVCVCVHLLFACM